MKKLFLCVLALSVCVLAADGSLEDRVDGLQAQIERALSKAGIHFGGEFRSQFLSSTVDGDYTDGAKKREGVEYTSVDFDIVARPNTALSARAIFRLHQDWRIFFSDVQNPITARWLSIDGAVADGIIKYNIGDYKKKLTPLTLWSPDLEFLFEPEIFAQNRELAMGEMFVGGNNRLLQGANLEFKAELYPILHEVEAGVFGARLAARGSGESGVIPPGVQTYYPNGEYWDALFDKYLVGTNLAAQIVKGAGVGVSTIHIFDNLNSFKGSDIAAKIDAQSNNVFAGRLNADTRIFMPDDFINVGVNLEAAYSMGTDYQLHPDDDPASPTRDPVENNEYDKGLAINAGLSAKVSLGEAHTFKLKADFIMNDSAFRNDAAQSPTFVQRRIMNNENGLSGSLDPNLGLMNPFDALYRTVFKYTPSQYFGMALPYSKNAYVNAILTKEQQADLTALSDSGVYMYPNVFQAALPGGMASQDRVGPVVRFDGSLLENAVNIAVKAVSVKTVSELRVMTNPGTQPDTVYKIDPITGLPELDDNEDRIIDRINPGRAPTFEGLTPDYLEFVGGLSVDIAKFAPAVGPSLVIGGSYGMYNSKYGDLRANESALLSGELNYNFYKNFSFLAGYQQLGTTVKVSDNEVGKYTFDNLSAGFGYKLEAGNLVAKLTMISGEWAPNGGDAVKYTAMQPEVFVTVRF